MRIFIKSFVLLVCCLGLIFLSVEVEANNTGFADIMDDDEESVRVPEGNGKPVLLDGLFLQGEWEDAKKVDIHRNVSLYLKKNGVQVSIGSVVVQDRSDYGAGFRKTHRLSARDRGEIHYTSPHGPTIKGDLPMDEIIMSMENGAMERWRKGDVWGWTEISDEEIIYVDPGLTEPIQGLEAYKEYLRPFEGKIDYQVSEFIDPKIKRYGDLAVLTYNYRDAKTEADGSIIEQSLWNTTEVYCLRDADWKIIHTHWSYIDQKLPEQTEVPVLVKQPSIKYEGVLGELMALEFAAMERWRKGDPWGFTDISAQEVTYFDTGTPKRIDGLEALKAEYAKRVGKIHYDVMEFIDPKIRLHGDAAVLFYRFFSTHLNPDGSIAGRIPWNCTEVYSKIDGKWKIVHTHWSFINGEVNR